MELLLPAGAGAYMGAGGEGRGDEAEETLVRFRRGLRPMGHQWWSPLTSPGYKLNSLGLVEGGGLELLRKYVLIDIRSPNRSRQ
jgi:hypothetical protein